MSESPDSPQPGCWPCRLSRRDKAALPAIRSAKARPRARPQSREHKYSQKEVKRASLLKNIEREKANDALQASSSGVGWARVQKSSSPTASLPVLDRPKSSTQDRFILAEQIRQKEAKAELVREAQVHKKHDKVCEAAERHAENKERRYQQVLKTANLVPSGINKKGSGFAYSLEDNRPMTPAARPPSARPTLRPLGTLKAINLEAEREAMRARILEKQEVADRARAKKIQCKVEKARESSVHGEQSRERRQKVDTDRRQNVKNKNKARLSSAQTRRSGLLDNIKYDAQRANERVRRVAERKRELDLHHRQIQSGLALRNPGIVEAQASRAEILEAVHSDFWDQ